MMICEMIILTKYIIEFVNFLFESIHVPSENSSTNCIHSHGFIFPSGRLIKTYPMLNLHTLNGKNFHTHLLINV